MRESVPVGEEGKRETGKGKPENEDGKAGKEIFSNVKV
jgi:hypothetical protein